MLGVGASSTAYLYGCGSDGSPDPFAASENTAGPSEKSIQILLAQESSNPASVIQTLNGKAPAPQAFANTASQWSDTAGNMKRLAAGGIQNSVVGSLGSAIIETGLGVNAEHQVAVDTLSDTQSIQLYIGGNDANGKWYTTGGSGYTLSLRRQYTAANLAPASKWIVSVYKNLPVGTIGTLLSTTNPTVMFPSATTSFVIVAILTATGPVFRITPSGGTDVVFSLMSPDTSYSGSWFGISSSSITLATGNPVFRSIKFGNSTVSAGSFLNLVNFTYAGAFRLPQTVQGPLTLPNGDTNPARFSYSEGPFTYDRFGNGGQGSFFIGGARLFSNASPIPLAEINKPALSLATSLSGLNTASFLQNFVDPVNGLGNRVNTPIGYQGNGRAMRGAVVYGASLVISYANYYDNQPDQTFAHFVRPKNLSASTPITGPSKIGTIGVMHSNGPMAIVPTAIQSTFGLKPLLTSMGLASIQANLSYGASIQAFDPSQIADRTNIPSNVLVDYTRVGFTNVGMMPNLIGPPISTSADASQTQNPYYNWTTKYGGVFWDATRQSVCVVARHGTGPFWYGTGNNVSVGGYPTGNDPANPSGQLAPHAPPYVTRVWVYKQSDVIAAKNGTVAPNSFLPVQYFDLTTPFDLSTRLHYLCGTSFDEVSRVLYIAFSGMDVSGYYEGPLVCAWNVS